MCVYIYIYMCVCVCIYIYIYIYIYTFFFFFGVIMNLFQVMINIISVERNKIFIWVFLYCFRREWDLKKIFLIF